jgi:hypothetical protein
MPTATARRALRALADADGLRLFELDTAAPARAGLGSACARRVFEPAELDIALGTI